MTSVKHYTTIEQSKKLLELGMNPESADMLWEQHTFDRSPYVTVKPWTTKGKSIGAHIIPCWSLGALLKLIDGIITEDGGLFSFMLWNHYNGWSIQCELLDYNHSCSTPIEAVYSMVVYLLENGFIKKVKTSSE